MKHGEPPGPVPSRFALHVSPVGQSASAAHRFMRETEHIFHLQVPLSHWESLEQATGLSPLSRFQFLSMLEHILSGVPSQVGQLRWLCSVVPISAILKMERSMVFHAQMNGSMLNVL